MAARRKFLDERKFSRSGLYEELAGRKPEDRYYSVFPEPGKSRIGFVGWLSHPDALRLAFGDLPRILENWDKRRVFVAWSVGVGNPPGEPFILAGHLKRMGIKYRIYATDINPEITAKIKRSNKAGSEIIPVTADILFAHPKEKPHLISLFVVAQYIPRKLQGKLASFLHSSLEEDGLLVTDSEPAKHEARYHPVSRSMNYEFFQAVRNFFERVPYAEKPPGEFQSWLFCSMWRKPSKTALNRRV